MSRQRTSVFKIKLSQSGYFRYLFLSGKISRYFLSNDYPQQVLLDSIRKAAKEETGVRDDRPFFLACIQVDPMTGARTLNILNIMKTGGVVTILALFGSMLIWNRKYKAAHGGTA